MKSRVILFSVLALFWACNSAPTRAGKAAHDQSGKVLPASYGSPITAEDAYAANMASHLLQDKDSLYVRMKGKVFSSCTKKGCWMLVDLGNEENMRVTFKNYAFFVPKDLKGEKVVMEGVLRRKISSVEEQQHYAEDAGKSRQDIEAIQKADTVYSFEAVGVLIWPLEKSSEM